MENDKEIKIIDVIPISKGMGKETLSYFISSETKIGSIVEVPLRNKKINAIVISQKNVSDIKTEIKKSSFTIKKAGKTKIETFLLPQFLKSAEETALYSSSTTGAVLNALIPKKILDNLDKIETKNFKEVKSLSEKLVIQAEDDERFANYKSLVREEFAKNRSIFFCLPTIEDIKKAKIELEKGIERYSFIIHSSLKEKEVLETWNRIIRENHPILIIGTYQYLSIPRGDIKTIVFEKENSSSYKSQIRPFIDARIFAENFSKNNESKLILGDLLLRTETLWREKNNEFIQLTPLKFRSISSAEQKMIDMTSNEENNEYDNRKKFKILSKELEKLIIKNKDNNSNLFIFGTRKGLYPGAVCGDCGHSVMCDRCSCPLMVKLQKNKDNTFFCQKCGKEKSALEKCSICKSWRLVPLGIGNDLIEKEILEKFPDIKIFKIDKDNIKSSKKAEELIEKFYASPGSILLGTEMALFYLNKQIENSAIVSIDSLFGIPDFSINEKIMRIILKIRSLTKENFILQTRNAEQEILNMALGGNIIEFYKEEIKDRKEANYPPFKKLIKITTTGDKKKIEKDIKILESKFKNVEYEIYPAFTGMIKGKKIVNCLLRIPRENWPDQEIVENIKSLSQNFTVKVDPENIL